MDMFKNEGKKIFSYLGPIENKEVTDLNYSVKLTFMSYTMLFNLPLCVVSFINNPLSEIFDFLHERHYDANATLKN
uniref:Uncharacterized protein n=1 Tax=Heterorhabditis bacteriophora TaxID=37862 RepID=A0A1I7WG98_HETBA